MISLRDPSPVLPSGAAAREALRSQPVGAKPRRPLLDWFFQARSWGAAEQVGGGGGKRGCWPGPGKGNGGHWLGCMTSQICTCTYPQRAPHFTQEGAVTRGA